ncbi:MAG: hypothetical protein IJY67_02350 [Paludibacteraceae bacterium]|nr:hypothetical protein [Paludibacteraceae bacterium]
MKHPKHILTITYYITLLLTILAAMIGYHLTYHKGIFFDANSQISTTYYTIVLWYVIITFPLSLKLFSLGVKRLKQIPDDGSREHYYKIYGVLRLAVMTIGLIASIIGIYIFQVKHLFWVAGICIIGVILCKPTEKRINADLTPLTPTEENSEENTEEN